MSRKTKKAFDDVTRLAEAVALHYFHVATQGDVYAFKDSRGQTYVVRFKEDHEPTDVQVNADEAHRLIEVEDKITDTRLVLDYTIVWDPDERTLAVDGVEIQQVGDEAPRWTYVANGTFYDRTSAA